MATSRTSARPPSAGSASSESPATRTGPAAKKAVAKKAVAKQATTKKAAVVKKAAAPTKVAAKKAAPTRVAAKKAVPTKAAARKAVASKAAPKKTPARQVPASKAAPKTLAASRAPAGTPRPRPRRKVEPDAAARLQAVVRGALDDLKARDITEIDVRGKSSVTDLMVIASGTSSRHVKSIADEVVRKAKQAGLPPLGVEGQREAEWVLVDLGDVVVHVMLPRVRDFYGLERLWGVGDAEDSEADAGMLVG